MHQLQAYLSTVVHTLVTAILIYCNVQFGDCLGDSSDIAIHAGCTIGPSSPAAALTADSFHYGIHMEFDLLSIGSRVPEGPSSPLSNSLSHLGESICMCHYY